MARIRTNHRCSGCGALEPKWSGRCPTCGEWNTLTEELVEPTTATSSLSATASPGAPVPITEVGDESSEALPTGIDELDRVLGGGLVPGSVTLLAGEPGVGKSTLVLQLLAGRVRRGDTALYVSGEESPSQVAERARRTGAELEGLLVVAERSVPVLLATLGDLHPEVCVVDSVQTLSTPQASGSPGSVTQVRDCTQQLVVAAKALGTTLVLIGHVTKDGSVAGPKVLEHAVDTVLSLEGDRDHALRVLRATKHRFGTTAEVGLMSLGGDGLRSVPDASGVFLADRRPGIPGSVVLPTCEGRRCVAVEVQALVDRSSLPQPRRSAKGLDQGRLGLLVAVLQRRAGVRLSGMDIYTMSTGGLRVVEPAADLAICLAVASALSGRPLPDSLVAFGEVGLGGELRQVDRLPQRLAEAARLGFTEALVPASSPVEADGILPVRVPTLEAAVDLFDLRPAARPSLFG